MFYFYYIDTEKKNVYLGSVIIFEWSTYLLFILL